MTPEEIPQELIDILDERAGKAHSLAGPVVAALAEILTRYQQIAPAPELWGAADAAAFLGVTRQRVAQLATTHADRLPAYCKLPGPVGAWVWRAETWRAFAQQERPLGRPALTNRSSGR